ncbi:MAG: PPC domain-containing protein [bacterium]
MRIVLVMGLGLLAFGCIPGGGGGGGGDDDEDRGPRPGDAAVVDVGAPDPDDGVPPPDRGVEADAATDPDDGVSPPDRGVEADAAPDPDDGVEADAAPDPDEGVTPADMAPPACVEGRVENRPCGLNGRGEATRVCAEGRWSPWGCEDGDVCVDATAETRPCAGGEERRICETGQWSAWGVCRPPPVCDPGAREVRGCGLNGRGEETRICGDGQWGAWGMCLDADVCVDDASENQACGLNNRGARTRRCVAGQWGAFGACADADVCRDGTAENRACGLNNRGTQARTCNRGQWGAYGACADPDVCRDGATEGRACGLNGRGLESRTCANGRWGAYGACGDPDVCVDGAVEIEPCPAGGDGERVCVEGQFGELEGCVGDVLCPPVGVVRVNVAVQGLTAGASRANGTCGQTGRGPEATWRFEAPAAGTYRFDTSGSAFDTVLYVRGTCDDAQSELECDDDGGDGNQSRLDVALAARQQVFVFVDGYYADPDARGQGAYTLLVSDVSACRDGAVEERACLDGNGIERRTCAQGVWSAWSACLCDAGDAFSRACGLNGRGDQDFVCAGGAFPANPPCDDPDACTDGAVERSACPAGGGVRERSCVVGEWSEGPCAGAVCPAAQLAVLGQQRGALVAGTSQLAGSCGTSGISPESTWSFTAPAAGDYTFDTLGSNFDTVLYLRSACGDAASEIACNDDRGGGGTTSRITTNLAAGQRITVVVDGYNGRVGDYFLTIAEGPIAVCVEEASEPNDDVESAVLLEPDLFGPDRVTGALCGADPDVYVVNADPNCLVTADLAVTAGAMPELALYTPDGMLLGADVEPPLSVGGASAQAGDWQIVVSPGDGPTTYTLDADVDCP